MIKWIEEGKIVSINSDALEYENSLTYNVERKNRIKSYLSLAKEHVELSEASIKRANEISSLGLRDMDALHISMAEEGRAHYFVTCDDGIVQKAKKIQKKLKVEVFSLLEFLEEVMDNVKDY